MITTGETSSRSLIALFVLIAMALTSLAFAQPAPEGYVPPPPAPPAPPPPPVEPEPAEGTFPRFYKDLYAMCTHYSKEMGLQPCDSAVQYCMNETFTCYRTAGCTLSKDIPPKIECKTLQPGCGPPDVTELIAMYRGRGGTCSDLPNPFDVPGCGNAITELGETCDTANKADQVSCAADCGIAAGAQCWNGRVDTGEECDAGINNGKLSAGCDLECKRIAAASGTGTSTTGSGGNGGTGDDGGLIWAGSPPSGGNGGNGGSGGNGGTGGTGGTGGSGGNGGTRSGSTSPWTSMFQGPMGPAGPAGPQGPAGETGPAGPQGPQGEVGPPGPPGPAGSGGSSEFAIPFTGTPTLGTYGQACPPGTTVTGSDQAGQIHLPDNQLKSQCLIYFAKPFASAPICVANLSTTSLDTYSDNFPTVTVYASTSFIRFILNKNDFYSPLNINYFCFNAPERGLIQYLDNSWMVNSSVRTNILLNR